MISSSRVVAWPLLIAALASGTAACLDITPVPPSTTMTGGGGDATCPPADGDAGSDDADCPSG
jgi:hypothetical protein